MGGKKGIRAIILAYGTKVRLLLQETMESLEISSTPCDDEGQFFDLLKNSTFDVALVVHGPGDADGELVTKRCLEIVPIPVIVLAQECMVEEAIKIMQAGAEDLILSPWDDQILKEAILKAVTNFPLRQQRNSRKRRIKQRELVCKSENMLRLLEIAKNIAPSRAAVLIQGESGTGKELLARYIHQESDRAHGPFVAINCASLPDTLLESELFGHEKGAFTGAISRKKGKFELADKGTILLDEITEMAYPLQAKLLRVLQEGEVDRLGGAESVPIDVRVIATTNRDVKKAISDGKFREDLYFRLNVIPLTLPPLRSRIEDIEALAEHFLEELSKDYGKSGLVFAKGVLEELKSRPWKGNVRELRNIIERGVLLAREGEVRLEDLFFDELESSLGDAPPASTIQVKDMFNLHDIEREVIKKALIKTGGNRTHAAKLLGISVRTLRNKLAEYREMGLVL